MSSASSLLLSTIARIKSKLGVNDLEGDKPVPENIKSNFDNFKSFLLATTSTTNDDDDSHQSPLVPEELSSIVEKAWDRSNKGKKLYNVSDLCWCLMNSADASMLTERKDGNASSSSTAPKSSSAPVVSRQDIESTSLIQFYKSLFLNNNKNHQVFEDQSEWSAFLDSLCSPLPMTFRLHQQGSYKSECTKILLQNDEGLKKIIHPTLGDSSSNSNIPSFGCSNSTYRDAPREQDLCRTAHSGGLWSFQEFVSMLPVASLQIQPHHKVFDMCAAPGSKSLQALDALNGQQQQIQQDSTSFLKNGGGCLLCNEKQPTKARQILPARMKRYGALQNVVLCSDATKMPWFVQSHLVSNNHHQQDESITTDPRFYFDRVMCDVPCCGDGTVRKDRSIFGTWNIDYVNQLADIQLRIARRAAGMLCSPGGRMAYSTCSLNPIEDEHVVFHLMCLMNNNQSKGAAQQGKVQLELVDVNEVLKNECGVYLKSSGGIDLGKFVVDENNDSGHDDAAAASTTTPKPFWSLEKLLEKIPDNFRPSMEDAKKLCSEIAKKVLRVFPHRDNTGGFFVALLQKKDNVPNALPKASKFQTLSNRKKFELVHPNDVEWKQAMEYFGLEDRCQSVFPSMKDDDLATKQLQNDKSYSSLSQPHIYLFPPSSSSSSSSQEQQQQPLIPFWCLAVNSPQPKRRIHLTTLSAASLVFNSQLAGGTLELVNFGVRLFERMPDNYLNLTVPQRLRLASEAADLVQPSKRVWILSKNKNNSSSETDDDDFIKNILLKGYAQISLPTSASSSSEQPSMRSTLPDSLLANIGNDNQQQLVPGSFVFRIDFTPTCQVWLAAMLTPLGKVDLLADGSVRRMLLQVFYGISLESHRVENNSAAAAGSRRQRTGGDGINSNNNEDEDGDMIDENDGEDF